MNYQFSRFGIILNIFDDFVPICLDNIIFQDFLMLDILTFILVQM